MPWLASNLHPLLPFLFLSASQAQVENLGRGSRRARAAATNYKEDDGLGELLSDDDSPGGLLST